jgi:RNA polymerase sigma-70 factor (ECF subfamily)
MKLTLSKTNLQTIAMNYINDKTDENFTKLFYRINPGLKKYISGFFKNTLDNRTDDVVSKTFYKAFKNIHQYNPEWNFSTWIYRIARNEALQELNKMKRFVYFSQFINSDGEQIDPLEFNGINLDDYIYNDEDKETAINDLYNLAINEINNLPILYKNILIDREINKLKYKDLAEKYNLNINTLKSRIRLGRQKIKAVLLKHKADLND